MLEYFYKNSAHISQTKQITPLKIFPLSHFNPRSREGSDGLAIAHLFHQICNFNPRSREGSDPIKDDLFEHIDDFNPRSREGSDITSVCAKKRQY